MGILEEDVRKVADDTDIISLIGEHTSLRKAGRNWMGLCVFHDERTPSMSVSPEGFYKCFGCGVGGDSITFVREKLGLSFVDAIEMLADRMGYQLRYTSETDNQVHSRKKELKEILAKAADFYSQELLKADSGGKARSYLRTRGYGAEEIKKWKLGWAPLESDTLYHALKVPFDLLVSAGLASRYENGEYGDFFRARILFPVFNQSGEPVAFGGRILPEGSGPKYLNSRDSEVYSKTRELYGLHRAKDKIVAQERSVVLEGYTDVIAVHSAGIEESVATCGTSLTDEHLRSLSRFSKNLILAFDPDSAGSSAMARAYDTIRTLEDLELEIKVAKLPADKDPAELAASDPDFFKEALDGAVPLMRFRLEQMFKNQPLDTNEDKYKASQKAGVMIADYFRGFKNASTSHLRDEYVNYAADVTGIAYSAIAADMQKTLKPAAKSTDGNNGKSATGDNKKTTYSDYNISPVEWEVLRWAVHRPAEIPECLDSQNFFERETAGGAFSALMEFDTFREAANQAQGDSSELLKTLFLMDPPSGDIGGLTARLIYSLAERKQNKLARDLQKTLSQNSGDGDWRSSDIDEMNARLEGLQKKMSMVMENNLKLDLGEYSALELLNWLKKQSLFYDQK